MRFELFRIGALQNRINIGNYSGLRNSIDGVFSKAIGLDLETAATITRVALKLILDPLSRRSDAVAGLD